MKNKLYLSLILTGLVTSATVLAEPITPEQLKQIELQYSFLKVQARGEAPGSVYSKLSPFPEGTEVREVELNSGINTVYAFDGKYRVEGVTSYEQAANKVIETFYDDLGFERGNTELQVKPGKGRSPWVKEFTRYYKGYPTGFAPNLRLIFDKDFALTTLINRYHPITGDKTVNFTMTIEEVKAKVLELMCGVDVCTDENSKFSATPYLFQHNDGTIDEMWSVSLEKAVEPHGRWGIDVDDGARSVYKIRTPDPWYYQKR
jgi:hypothetical protein